MITVRGLEQLGFVCRGIDPVSPYDFALQDDGDGPYISVWNSKKEKPTEKEIEEADAEWQKDYDALQYQRDRQYPALGEQLDMLFHDMTVGKGTKDGEWYKAVKKVKDDNPKPSE